MTKWIIRIVTTFYTTLLVGIPVGSIVYRAIRPGLHAFYSQLSTPDAVHALELTVEVTALAVVFNTIFGLGIALLLARHAFLVPLSSRHSWILHCRSPPW